MSDFWIVSNYKFTQQPSLTAAEGERARLQHKCPKKTFRVYRCKSHLNPTGAYADVLEALKVARAVLLGINDVHKLQSIDMALSHIDPAIAKAEGGT